jgi:hypothetical protein
MGYATIVEEGSIFGGKWQQRFDFPKFGASGPATEARLLASEEGNAASCAAVRMLAVFGTPC